MNNQYTAAGIFTATTPTLTPTTLRSIETILDEDQRERCFNGSFVPPLPNSNTVVLTNSWQGGRIITEEEEEENFINETPVQQQPAKKTRGGKRAAGGRRPNMSKVSPEEDERRKVRRERNKLAAARCRKRRVDHTNTLVEETEQLESIKRTIQKEINELQSQRDELEFILQAHNTNCTKTKKFQNNSMIPPATKKQRPTTLAVVNPIGIQLSTPSSGLNFDHEWSDLQLSTGLTPTSNSLALMATPSITPSTVQAILSNLNNIKSETDEYVEL